LTVLPEWVRGHAGDPMNELADQLSKLGASNGANVEIQRSAAPDPLSGLQPRDAWEQQFLSSVRRQLRDGRSLSDKQQAIIDRIRARGAPSA
jgi:hypothetical protein